jgi:hypothetical protein
MSRLLHPFRDLGMVSSATPIGVQQSGQESFIATSIGRSYQLYSASKLTLLFVGPYLEHNITCLQLSSDIVYAASGNHVFGFKRAKEVLRVDVGGEVADMVLLGSTLVRTLSACSLHLIGSTHYHSACTHLFHSLSLSLYFHCFPHTSIHPHSLMHINTALWPEL